MDEIEEFAKKASGSLTSSLTVSYLDSDSDASLWRCFKESELSSSSVFLNPLYYLPEPETPAVFEALRYEPPLDIDNDIGCERYVRICKTLQIPPLSRVLQCLDKEELDLSYYGLRIKELHALFHVLEINAYIKTLILEENFMEPESVHLLGQMLAQNFAIKILDLKKCNIGPEGAKALKEGLENNYTLEELDLSFNFIGDDGFRALKTAFKNNNSIMKINLGNNRLSSACAKNLQEIFVTNETLTDFNLEWNNVSDDGAIKKFAAGLKVTKNLVSLNLSWNGLDSDNVAKELSRYIRESQKLETIDLSNNMFKDKSIELFSKAIGSSPSLKHVKLGSNPMTPNAAVLLGSLLLPKDGILEILNLANVYFPKSFNSKLRRIKKSGKTLIHGGVLSDFKIKGPNTRHVLLKRCHYLGLAPKKAKAKRDFGQIVLTLPENPMSKAEFEEFIRKKKKAKMYDLDLLAELRKAFDNGNAKIDTRSIVAEYMKLYPDTALPPSKPKKGKKAASKTKKMSKTRVPSKIEVESSPPPVEEETTSIARKVSFSEEPRPASAADPTSLRPRRSVISQGEIQDEERRRSSSKNPPGETSEQAKSAVKISSQVEIFTTD